METPSAEEQIATLQSLLENTERSLTLVKQQHEAVALANRGLQMHNGELSDILLHVVKACNEHPNDAERLLSKDLFIQLKSIAGRLAA